MAQKIPCCGCGEKLIKVDMAQSKKFVKDHGEQRKGYWLAPSFYFSDALCYFQVVVSSTKLLQRSIWKSILRSVKMLTTMLSSIPGAHLIHRARQRLVWPGLSKTKQHLCVIWLKNTVLTVWFPNPLQHRNQAVQQVQFRVDKSDKTVMNAGQRWSEATLTLPSLTHQ